MSKQTYLARYRSKEASSLGKFKIREQTCLVGYWLKEA
ncbi:uncharacterized protein RSE6_10143 [Rhynchosporium secalis]|uniref:Uncharacterized protein n=1 Tax=Rhynchosporium secalis TaxID=38038 RepID=A0A1E1MJR0_RHYSE|nr:uncharacterized protein RSE6_10143 [Rhynchosporium secalis]